jgi:hypothetical protein
MTKIEAYENAKQRYMDALRWVELYQQDPQLFANISVEVKNVRNTVPASIIPFIVTKMRGSIASVLGSVVTDLRNAKNAAAAEALEEVDALKAELEAL